jgi:hypothetical protein
MTWYIFSDDTKILNKLTELERLIMGVKEDLTKFATDVDAITNIISTNVTKVAQVITDLQAALAAGTITPLQMSAALDPVKAHLQTVADALKSVADGGSTVIPPPPDPL